MNVSGRKHLIRDATIDIKGLKKLDMFWILVCGEVGGYKTISVCAVSSEVPLYFVAVYDILTILRHITLITTGYVA